MALHDGCGHVGDSFTAQHGAASAREPQRAIYVSRAATERAATLCEELHALRASELTRVLQDAAFSGEVPERPYDKVDEAEGRLIPEPYRTTNGDRMVVLVVADRVIPGGTSIATVKPLRSCYRQFADENDGARDLRAYLDATTRSTSDVAVMVGSDAKTIEQLLRGRTPPLRLALALESQLAIDPRAWLETAAVTP
jgi:hypothetical protein